MCMYIYIYTYIAINILPISYLPFPSLESQFDSNRLQFRRYGIPIVWNFGRN